MSDEPILNFDEQRRQAANALHAVPCARCGKRIPMNAARCPECGVHFGGEAFQFSHTRDAEPGEAKLGTRGLVILVAIPVVLILAAMVFLQK